MSAHDWTIDHDSGLLHNHYISNNLLLKSMGKCKVVPFTTKFEDFGKGKGETVNIMRVNELPDPTSTELEEGTRIPIDKLTYGNRTITVTEWGRGVEFTNLAKQLSKFNPEDILQKALIRQMERAMDTNAAQAFQTTDVKICYIPTSLTGGTFDTDGTPSTVATFNLTFDHMGVLADYLAGDIHCPPYEGDDYIMLACRKSLRGIKNDTTMQQLHMYLQKGDFFFKGELGKMENIRCVQIDREAAFSNTAGMSTVMGEAVVFGDEAVVRVEVETCQLYVDRNYQNDFGRVKAAAWRGINKFASIHAVADDGLARIIRVTSA